MKNGFGLTVIVCTVGACGGGTSPALTPPPTSSLPGVASPVVVPSAVVPPDPTPPPIVAPLLPVPPTSSACETPTTSDAVVLFDRTAMTNICSKTYLESGVPADEELTQRQNVASAYVKVATFYGGTLVAPRADIILCKTASCRTFFIGTERAAAFVGAGFKASSTATYITPRETMMVIYTSFLHAARGVLSHELSHVELNARIKGGRGVPAWFNEGQASMNDEDNGCATQTARLVADLRTLDDGAAWNASTATGATGPQIYCQANREVSAWITKNGKAAYLNLLSQVKTGVPFYTAYGAMLTQ